MYNNNVYPVADHRRRKDLYPTPGRPVACHLTHTIYYNIRNHSKRRRVGT